jgi:hypothetical protein
MQQFATDSEFNPSHKLGQADAVTLATLTLKLGEPNYEDEYDSRVSVEWSGQFTASDGTVMRASVWDYKGSLAFNKSVSLWVSNGNYLNEFKEWLIA